MDSQGYVDLDVLANFNRVKALTTDKNLIRDALRRSYVVEITNDDKVRRREGWETWVLPAVATTKTEEPVTPPMTNNTVANGDNDNKRHSAEQDDVFQFEDDAGTDGKTVQKYYLSENEDDDEHEIDEETVARIMIVTQRKGDRSHSALDPSKDSDMINEGLYQYEAGMHRSGNDTQFSGNAKATS